MSRDEGAQTWYARRGSTLLGPYTGDELERYVLLGRIRLSDRVSSDGQTWFRLGECEGLIPDAMRDLETPEGRARYEAARREVDQRSGGSTPRRGGRRQQDPGTVRPLLALWGGGAALAVVVAVLVGIGAQLDFGGTPQSQPDCAAEAAPGVDWSYCVFNEISLPAGADLSGLVAVHVAMPGAVLRAVNLRDARLAHADLAGADLREADLARANLEGADLRATRLEGATLAAAQLQRADLRAADLDDVDLDGADLSGAAWASGEWCRDGSVGECVRE